MKVQRLAAFTRDGEGGNPAGVVLCDRLPEEAAMQATAREVGFSETVFAMPMEDGAGFRARYFAPEGEVPFCGHATIALGAALGAAQGPGHYGLTLNDAAISVEAYPEGDAWGARLTSPPTSYAAAPDALLDEALALFGLHESDLDPEIPPALVSAGARHLLIALCRHSMLQAMSYDFAAGAGLMRQAGLVTINLIWRENPGRIHSRNAFAGHGVYEDPATGAAAAALAGYLRDNLEQGAPFEVLQGREAAHPSRLLVRAHQGRGAPVEVSGAVRRMAEPTQDRLRA